MRQWVLVEQAPTSSDNIHKPLARQHSTAERQCMYQRAQVVCKRHAEELCGHTLGALQQQGGCCAARSNITLRLAFIHRPHNIEALASGASMPMNTYSELAQYFG